MKNNPSKTGVILLEDLPEKEIFINLKYIFHKKIENRIRFYGIYKFCKKLNISNRIVCHWLTDGSLIRLDILNRILNFLNYSLDSKISFMRGNNGACIYNPKLPFNFATIEGVRIIAAIFGDGCLDKRLRVFYANSNKDLIDGFLNDVKSVFGNVKYDKRQHFQHNHVDIITLSPFIGKIVSLLGIKKGKKVENNFNIPNFIFDLNKQVIGEFLSQIIDDEGSINLKSRYLKIKFAVLSSKKVCNITDGVKTLIQSLGINCYLYNFEKRSYSGKERTFWQIQVSSIVELQKLYSFLNLRHKEKDRRLNLLFNTVKQIHYPKNKCTNIYLSIMKNLQKNNGHFTSCDIAKVTKRHIGSCRNTLIRLKKQGLIECFNPHDSGSHSYARYKVVV